MISQIIIFGIIVAISTTLLGYGLLLTIKCNDTADAQTKELEVQLRESLRTSFGRILSASIQLILYTALILFTISLIHQTEWVKNSPLLTHLTYFQPGLHKFIAFILGGLLSTGLALAFFINPHCITSLLQLNKGSITNGSSSIFITAASIGCIGIGIFMLGVFSCLYLSGADTLIAFGLGTLFSAYFLRLGGGLFKTAADISTNIIKTREKNIPLFDTRNPLTILHISSKFLSSLNGFSSDIMSSLILTIIAFTTLATSQSMQLYLGKNFLVSILSFGLLILITSLISAIIGSFITYKRLIKKKKQNSLLEGLYTSLLVIGITAYFLSKALSVPSLFPPILIGIFGAIIVGFTSEILTSHNYPAAKKLAKNSEYGAPTTFLRGYSAGLLSTPIFIGYSLLILGSAYFYSGFIGCLIAILGFLTPTPFILIMTAFKPLALSIQDLNELTNKDSVIDHNIKQIKLLSHTTAAIGNGYASGATILSGVGIVISLLQSNFNPLDWQANPTWVITFLFGCTIPALSNGLLLRKLNVVIRGLVQETLRQFREIPYLYQHKARPDVVKAADTHARNCMDSLALPAALLVIPPIFITLLVGKNALFIYILGALVLCALQTFSFANTGDVLNHAKHLIAEGRFGGKNSSTYTHISTADTIGDAFKDLLNPNMNILIKGLLLIGTLLLKIII